jgi:DNA-binding NarL/FixJ family response regulator
MAALRRRLAPHRDTVVVAAGPTVCTGPVTLVLAGLAGACGDLDEARALLGTAGAQADQLESPLFRAHVATALAELDAAAPDLPSGLSRREAEVLGLLAAGLTNKEVAARLHVGVRTVDSHVSSIYRKVGARRRGEAVAFAMAHGLDAGGRSDAGNP